VEKTGHVLSLLPYSLSLAKEGVGVVEKEHRVANLRQKILILYSSTPDLHSGIGAWRFMMEREKNTIRPADSEEPPYSSVLAAMKDGWRVIQFPQQFPAYPGMELSTSYLRFEYILEKMEDVDHGG